MAAERISIWDIRSWRIRNIFQPKTLPREKQPLSPVFTQALKGDEDSKGYFFGSGTPSRVLVTNNRPAIKQLNDLISESRAVAHAEIAVLSKPTPKFTKDRIFEFVEAANRPVSVAEIAAALPDVARSGVSSRVSEMWRAGSLSCSGYINKVLRYTVAETK
jgi:hypothetical protein